MTRKTTLRIGNAGGYWGDDPGALKRQVEGGPLDYITIDFLAEVTMSILQRQHAQDPSQGYARDFIPMLAPVLGKLLSQKTRIITNAGGINPSACAAAIAKMASEQGLSPRIAVVYGDDILQRTEELESQGVSFQNMETSADFASVRTRLSAANVYFGAFPVVEALHKWQPDIIVTGRVTDTGITLAPMIYEFGWDMKDWDKLAAGIVAGHLLECGCQVTGGNFSDWHLVKNFHHMGYPIAEVNPDGSFVLTKHPNTGGLVSKDSVREQLFYEMGNPKAYITPDVVADFSSITLQDLGNDRVKVFGVKGFEPTPTYKVSMAYDDGWKAMGSILLSGPKARAKAEKFAEIFWNRCPDNNYTQTLTEYLGWNACHRSLGHQDEGNEIVLRLGARAQEPASLKLFAKMIPSLILSGPPGVTVLGGVPKPQAIVSYWPALLPKQLVSPKIALYRQGLQEACTLDAGISGSFVCPAQDLQVATEPKQSIQDAIALKNNPLLAFETYPLSALCLARSGDKGDSANIGLLARGPQSYEFIKEHITAQRVKDLFQELCLGKVSRYSLDRLEGLNFLLDQSLGGGGSCTLRADAQGKTFSQALLRQRVQLPEAVRRELHLD